MKSLGKSPFLRRRILAGLALSLATATAGTALGNTPFNAEDPNMIRRGAESDTSQQSPSSLNAEVGMPGATEKGCIKCMQAKLFNSDPVQVQASAPTGSSSQQGNQ